MFLSKSKKSTRGARSLVLLTLVLGLTQAQLAGGASAHHPEVQASVSCGGQIEFSSVAWETTDLPRRENHDIRIDLRTFNGSVWSTWSEIGQGQFLPTQNPAYQFSGTHQLSNPIPQQIEVRARNVVKWGPLENLGGIGSRTTGALTVPDCPPEPSASIIGVDCSEGGALISFANTGGGDVSLDVYKNDVLIDTVDLGGESTTQKTYAMDENETATFTVKSGDETLDSETLTLNCRQPSANITHECAEGGAKIIFSNEGEVEASFLVLKNGDVIDEFTIAPQGEEMRTYAMSENEVATYEVTSDEFSTGEIELTQDCILPSAEVAQDCFEGGARITFTNDGESEGTFAVLKNGDLIDTVNVAASSEESKIYPMLEDETATFEVRSDEYSTGEVEVTHDCINPAASISSSCTDGGALVELTNQAAQILAVFDISRDGSAIDQVVVDPNGTVQRTYSMSEGETATFTATAHQFEESETLTFNCVDVLGGDDETGPAVLPATGLNGTGTSQLVVLALALVLSGIGLLLSGRVELELG